MSDTMSVIQTGTVSIQETGVAVGGSLGFVSNQIEPFDVVGGATSTSFAGFNPALGTLNHVILTFSISGSASASLTPYAGYTSESFYAIANTSLVFLSGSQSSPLSVILPYDLSEVSSPVDFTPGSEGSLVGPISLGPASIQLNLASNIYFDNASYELGFDFQDGIAASTAMGGYHANAGDTFTESVTATVTVEYDYTPACFLGGTLIGTPDGERAVETLKAGDRVYGVDRIAHSVRWLGRSTVSSRFRDPLRVFPIRIRAGALGKGLPSRDLLVSPDHAMFLCGFLIQASALVNGMTVIRETNVPEVFTYYHLELDAHRLVLANGAATESFIDNIDRMAFDNWNEHPAQDGQEMSELPYARAKSARQLPASVRRLIAERIMALGNQKAIAA